MTEAVTFSLAGKRALVTGGGGDLGQEMAGALHEAGAQVVVAGRSATVEAARDRIAARRAGGAARTDVHAVIADLTAEGGCVQAVGGAVQLLGGLDILLIAHGTSAGRGPSLEITSAEWATVMDSNLASVFYLCREAGAIMTRQGHGKIITVASMLSFFGGVRAAGYAASKGGVAQLTKSLANEWGPLGVNVNAIAPGFMKTRLTAHVWGDPVRYQQTLARIPAGRWGEPADLAGVAVFLASPASDYVHGAVIPVDGGYLAR
jgi:2-deoxy-D-gluconate 3-dehydrogenase